jgi:hypothetical protein
MKSLSKGDNTKEKSLTGQPNSEVAGDAAVPASPSQIGREKEVRVELSSSASGGQSGGQEFSTNVPSDHLTEKSSKDSKLSALHTLIGLYSALTIVISIIGILAFIAILTNAKSKYDNNTNPLEPQSITYYLQFELLEYAGAWIFLFFFRKIQVSSSERSRSEQQQRNKKQKAAVVKPTKL